MKVVDVRLSTNTRKSVDESTERQHLQEMAGTGLPPTRFAIICLVRKVDTQEKYELEDIRRKTFVANSIENLEKIQRDQMSLFVVIEKSLLGI